MSRNVRIALLSTLAIAVVVAVVAGVTGIFSSSGLATRSDWRQLRPAASPGARDCAAAAYDDSSGQLLMFGGESSTIAHVLGTWSWTGKSWRQLHVAVTPPWASCASMAYDGATQDVVLFGGTGGPQETQYSSTTWLWNGSDWSMARVKAAPPGRAMAAMAYDIASGQVILFGGQPQKGVLGDTWSWTGSGWKRLHPAHSPPAAADQVMAYDPTNHGLVLFGGFSVQRGAPVTDSVTWIWNRNDWQKTSPTTSPPGLTLAGMAYDGSSDRIILFGGGNVLNGTQTSETWEWTGTNWFQLAPSRSPSARLAPVLVYDPEERQLILFGGFTMPSGNSDGETWAWK